MVKNSFNDDVVVKFKSDSQGSGTRKGFEAVYTFIPFDACKYCLSKHSLHWGYFVFLFPQ